MQYKKILDFLYSRGIHSVHLGLERMEKLMKKLGNPEKNLKIILVAGTNGKGSTASMISSILKEAGFKVGLYTSPHMSRFTERFKINGVEIFKKDIEAIFDEIKPVLVELDKGDAPTYFEIVTAMAYTYFKQQEVDFAVVEVGMGGRLDATNIINPIVAVITNVSREHTQYLGKKIEEIAFEKAGIIKKNNYVVTAAEDVALDVLKEVCMRKEATLQVATPIGLDIGLKGEFQMMNAGVAIKAVKTLKHFGYRLPKMALVNGLEKASLPGRFEFVKQNMLVDCAHNVAGIECLVSELNLLKNKQDEESRYENLHLVFGAMKDKDVKSMIELLEPLADSIILTKPHGERDEMLERAEDPKNIARFIDNHKKVIILEKPEQALKKAKRLAKEDDLIVVCGSCFLVGDVMRL